MVGPTLHKIFSLARDAIIKKYYYGILDNNCCNNCSNYWNRLVKCSESQRNSPVLLELSSSKLRLGVLQLQLQCSFVLLSIADASVKFISFNLGSPGTHSDGGILKDCGL